MKPKLVLAPAGCNSAVPAAVPSVTQSPVLSFASRPENSSLPP